MKKLFCILICLSLNISLLHAKTNKEITKSDASLNTIIGVFGIAFGLLQYNNHNDALRDADNFQKAADSYYILHLYATSQYNAAYYYNQYVDAQRQANSSKEYASTTMQLATISLVAGIVFLIRGEVQRHQLKEREKKTAWKIDYYFASNRITLSKSF